MAQTTLEVGGLSDIGMVRSRNEDSMGNWVPEPSVVESRGHLFIVADGMGGHAAGNVASKMAVELSTRTYYYNDFSKNPGENLEYAIKVANREIYDEAQRNPDHHRMGTTFVGIVSYGDEAYVANVGDSRAYLIRKGTIQQVTKDHSWVALQVEMGEITQEEAETSQNRSILLRCLGEKPDVLVDSQVLKLEESDVYVLCSDGLHGLVSNEEIRLRVEEMEPQSACQSLVDLANSRGGHDNVTVLVVKVKEAHAASVPPPPRNHERIVVESSTLPAKPSGIGPASSAPVVAPPKGGGVMVAPAAAPAKTEADKKADPAETLMPDPVPSPAQDKRNLLAAGTLGAVAALLLAGWFLNSQINHDDSDGPVIQVTAMDTPSSSSPSAAFTAPSGDPSQEADSASPGVTGTSITIRSSPNSGATVVVDGKPMGKTPLTLTDLPPGPRKIVVKDGQGHELHRDVTLSAGAPADINVDFTYETPVP